MTSVNLTSDEMARWTQWKSATDTVWGTVVGDITAATGLSAAEFAVITRVVELGHGTLRQQVLADELGWQRARLSRQVGRMVERGLLERDTHGAVVTVTATPEGKRAAVRARRAHAQAVRRALLAVATGASSAPFWETVEQLAGRTTQS